MEDLSRLDLNPHSCSCRVEVLVFYQSDGRHPDVRGKRLPAGVTEVESPGRGVVRQELAFPGRKPGTRTVAKIVSPCPTHQDLAGVAVRSIGRATALCGCRWHDLAVERTGARFGHAVQQKCEVHAAVADEELPAVVRRDMKALSATLRDNG